MSAVLLILTVLFPAGATLSIRTLTVFPCWSINVNRVYIGFTLQLVFIDYLYRLPWRASIE